MASAVKGTKMENAYSPGEIDLSLILRDSVRDQLDSLPAGKSHIIKDMAYSVTGFYDMLPSKESNFKHVFLIRKPECMFPSWRRLLMIQLKIMGMEAGKPIEDATFDMTTDVPFDAWIHNIDPNPVIIDADELAMHPAELLPKLCEVSGMPFDPVSWNGTNLPTAAESGALFSPSRRKTGL
ncbi:uncharacterized protein LOC115925418 [Strongylocentrotus purpuratus]|uniref:Sulfotransferase family protein n=1 Tax=Strongylocentrotus purpuratus TaxID=7668 RepID=A0A7M7P7P2_STRPU|nr:uncharacterized protein LOC115925418 [Strongylocentrotus purpuratus]